MVDIDALWNFDDGAGSEARLREAAAAAQGRDARVLQTQVARALGLQQRYDEAHAILDAVTDDGEAEVATRVALERGRLWRSAGEVAAALPLFRDAVRMASAAGLDVLAVDALHMVAIAEPDAAASRSITYEALAIARDSADPRAQAWEASLLNNLGMTYADTGDWPQALPLFEEALVARRRTGTPEGILVARWMVAWALRNLGRREEALTIQRALAAEHDAAGTDDPYVRDELAILEGPD